MGLHQLVVLLRRNQVRVLHTLAQVRRQRVHLATVLLVRLQSGERLHDGLLELDALRTVHGAWQVELLQVAAHAHTHGQLAQAQLRHIQHATFAHSRDVPVRLVHSIGRRAVVVTDDRVEERVERLVVVRRHGVAAHAGVLVLEARAHTAQQGRLLVGIERVEVVRIEVLHGQVVRVALLDLCDQRERVGIAGSCGCRRLQPERLHDLCGVSILTHVRLGPVLELSEGNRAAHVAVGTSVGHLGVHLHVSVLGRAPDAGHGGEAKEGGHEQDGKLIEGHGAAGVKVVGLEENWRGERR